MIINQQSHQIGHQIGHQSLNDLIVSVLYFLAKLDFHQIFRREPGFGHEVVRLLT